MDDDLQGAQRGLAQGNSAFHKLAKGVLGFMKATLGFEQEIMKEASEQLSEAENSAYSFYYKAQHDPHAFTSNIYEKGTEFALCQAESQIMSAVVGVLNESLTESIKGFYKLRKAYITLDGIIQMETNYMKTRGVSSLASSRPGSSDSLQSSGPRQPKQVAVGKFNGSSSGKVPAVVPRPSALRQTERASEDVDGDSDGSDEFYDVDEVQEDNSVAERRTENNATGERGSALDQQTKELDLNAEHRPTSPLPDLVPSSHHIIAENEEAEIFSDSLDVFIHSGTNLCYGILSLLISMIPPAFSKLLYIIGFRGDRARGIKMLWQASKFSNVNGGLAALVLFGWYNGLVGFCDIIPDTDANDPNDVEGYPRKRLEALLLQMRDRYPKSHLWLIEEARMASSRRNLDQALTFLAQPAKSQLKQLEGFHMFEKSLSAMHSHRYELCAESFITCVGLNAWSQALYYYNAASAHVELHRRVSDEGDQESAAKHKKLAEEYFDLVPSHVGKKKMMGKQLPFDVFVTRKLAKWQERAEKRGCSFIDAIGVSPLEEMILLWNGYKKMNEVQLGISLNNLAWSEKKPDWQSEDLDERAILAVLRATIFRNLRQHDQAKAILRREVLCHGSHEFKGQNKDDWTAPTAHYEMAVNLWMQREWYTQHHGTTIDGSARVEGQIVSADVLGDAKIVQECKQYVEKAKNWEKYELDARMGMKVTAASDAIKKWEAKHGAVPR